MPFENFLDHACDIYHVVSTSKTPGYGLPASVKHTYLDVASETNVACHFAQGGSGGTVNTFIQRLPDHDYGDRIKVVFPIGTDIRMNDKIVDKRTGLVYYAEIPRVVHGNHHIYVFVSREDNERVI